MHITNACIDLFCGAGGLTRGLLDAGIRVVSGVDLDPVCRVPYERNNPCEFVCRNIRDLSAHELSGRYMDADVRILAGCAPCQPFSTYAMKYAPGPHDERWDLMLRFAGLIEGVRPDVVVMENVANVIRYHVFHRFVDALGRAGYHVWYDVVECMRYGVPQIRKRLVLLASRLGELRLIPPTHDRPVTVRETIGHLPPLEAGKTDPNDPLHTAAGLSQLNLERIKASRPGGTWRDWPRRLVADCHLSDRGRTYPSVYGRMSWDEPAPTLTTQCYAYGSGRFGHPEQHRAISLREAAMLQGFPEHYVFSEEGEHIRFGTMGKLIGNAVPVPLARAIGWSIRKFVFHETERDSNTPPDAALATPHSAP